MSDNQKRQGKKSVHDGHRDRLRKRYTRSGLDDFAPHEVLELLLTYCIPRVDVNCQAHALIERFGSLSAVMDATEEELCEVHGIGPESARFLAMLPSVFRQYAEDKAQPGEPMETLEKIGTYLQAKFVGLTYERVYLLLFDNSMRLIDCCLISDGAVNAVHIGVRNMAELALRKHASCAVVAHNHPRGLAIPSGEDREMTEFIEEGFNILGIPLVEHIIVAENSYAPIMRNQKGLLRASPKAKVDEGFYRRFYGE